MADKNKWLELSTTNLKFPELCVNCGEPTTLKKIYRINQNATGDQVATLAISGLFSISSLEMALESALAVETYLCKPCRQSISYEKFKKVMVTALITTIVFAIIGVIFFLSVVSASLLASIITPATIGFFLGLLIGFWFVAPREPVQLKNYNKYKQSIHICVKNEKVHEYLKALLSRHY